MVKILGARREGGGFAACAYKSLSKNVVGRPDDF
jgi:hypothetical protein